MASFIARKVNKGFDTDGTTKIFEGTVTAYDAKDPLFPFQVKYEDGDSEDLSTRELRTILVGELSVEDETKLTSLEETSKTAEAKAAALKLKRQAAKDAKQAIPSEKQEHARSDGPQPERVSKRQRTETVPYTDPVTTPKKRSKPSTPKKAATPKSAKSTTPKKTPKWANKKSRTVGHPSSKGQKASSTPKKLGTPRQSISMTPKTFKPDLSITREKPDGELMFSKFVKYGGVIYMAGQTPSDTSDTTVKGQAQQVLKLVDELVTKAGSSKQRILKVTCILADIGTVGEWNEAWAEWLDKDNMPVRATFEGKLVKPEFKIELVVEAAYGL
mmetsp:Transcript_21415/g.29749  ORF Transcript_21415/g.29749 Transcript_21415/m.29749 type:complete len:330 (-) Transcript_21415:189-1178(-)|eukprot:CAMPEP_0196595568 /NCGR_PEP_ID=MMETSP1081-20130531/81358_1 /TAXON_ID=36882 /ORGANISM="Pyramimonas amylifera, Strain CCMP720" /LENGTH=329 /DNA_ID=CAMNT_0041920179 /DNA_START=61 /DNA_END=1050 /DNA_ORIENTATION=+